MTKSDARPPNILVLMSDQHNPRMSSPYGHPFVSTPTLQRLADRGVTFETAYCPSPLCVPSRSAFLTGLPVHRLGAWDNSRPLPADEPTWAHRLNAAGYETALCGRMSIGGPYQGHGFARRPHHEMHPGRWGSSFPDWSQSVRSRGPGTRTRLENAGPGDTPQQRYDASVTEAAVAYLAEPARRERPWAAVVGWFLPHTPLTVREPYFQRYHPEHADQPTAPAGDPRHKHPQTQRFRILLDAEGLTPEQIRRSRAAYYGMVTFIDDHVGQVLDALESAGLADDTLVIYTSDHGEMLGEHGLWWKSSFHESSVRVPLIASWPGRIPAGSRVSTPVSLLDLTRTIVAAAGADADRMEGDDLLPAAFGQPGALDPERAVFAEYEAHGTTLPGRMLRRGRYKLNYYHGEPPELFDLQDDQHELHDLSGDPAHAALRDDMVARTLDGWDPAEIDRRVRESQRRRRILFAGLPES